MNGLQRATERAQREGRLKWTQDDGERSAPEVIDAPPPVAAVPDAQEPARVAVITPAAPIPVAMRPISPSLVAATDPGSFAADQYRFLRTRLQALENGSRIQTLMVTSPGRGDGKSTTSANLALTMARELQQPVVLVEGDLRRPALAALFGARAELGIVDVLMGNCSLDEALIELPGQPLFLLPAGGPVTPSSDLFASSMMQRTLSALRARFVRIIVDAPPVVAAETHALARLADRLLVVVRAGVTPRPALARALAVLDQQRVLGIVLNEVDAAPQAYGYASLPERGSRP